MRVVEEPAIMVVVAVCFTPKGWPPPLLSLPQLLMTHDGYMEVRIYPQGRAVLYQPLSGG